MRAPLPALQRLFRLAALPAQRGAAWQALDAALARLDPASGGPALSQAAQAARLDALLQNTPPGAALAPLLDRLLGTGWADPADQADTPAARGRTARPASALPSGGGLAGIAGDSAGLPAQLPVAMPRRQPQAAGQPAALRPAGMPWPMRPAASMAATGSTAGRVAAARRLAGLTKPSALAGTTSAPAASGTAVGGSVDAPPSSAFGLPSPTRQTGAAPGGQWPPPHRSAVPAALPVPAWPDAAAARQGWQRRLDSAGLAAAWHAAVRAKPAAQAQPPGLGAQAPTPAAAADAAAAAAAARRPAADIDPAQGSPSDRNPAPTNALAQALAYRLDTLAAPRGRQRPAAATVAAASPFGMASSNASAPLRQGARIGGFKGLAALGLPAAATLTAAGPGDPAAASAGQATAPGWPPARPGWPTPGPTDDPQHLIDAVDAVDAVEAVEAALREQAARNGIALDL